MTDLLWQGLDALIVALITLLGYELHAFLVRDKNEPVITHIVRRWRGDSLWKKIVVFTGCTIVAWSIQFLGFHFAFDVA